jgi:hypothetical protein
MLALALLPAALAVCADADDDVDFDDEATEAPYGEEQPTEAPPAGDEQPTGSDPYGAEPATGEDPYAGQPPTGDATRRVDLEADFEPPQGTESDVAGTVRILVAEPAGAEGSAPQLAVDLTGLEPGEHAWHIHEGSCEADTPPVEIALSPTAEMEGITGPLVVQLDGTASAEVPVPQLEYLMTGSGRYSLHVHEHAGTDHGATVACANL